MSALKMDKNYLLVISVLLLGLNADAEQSILSDKYPIINAYSSQYNGKRSIDGTRTLLTDKCFIDANSFIYDKDKQKKIVVRAGDVENKKDANKTVVTQAPDYESALTALTTCVNTNSNPVAAWEGLYIIKSFFGIDYKKNIAAYKNFSKILYDDKSCDGFINYGDIYKNGIGTKVDEKVALGIYTEGLAVCKKDWQNIALEMRINKIKAKVKAKK